MTPGDIWELRETQPFVPFRTCLTDGKRYDVPHRDFVMISRTVIDIGVASQLNGGICDQMFESRRITSCAWRICRRLNRLLKKSFSSRKSCKNTNDFEGRFFKTCLFQQPVNR